MEHGYSTESIRIDTAMTELHRRISVQFSASNSPMKSPSSPTTPILPPTSPRDIVLALWPRASNSQIQSYVEGYQTLYPSAQVHLLHCSGSSGGADIKATLGALTLADEKPPYSQGQTILLHLFGNAGSVQACCLLRDYRSRTGQTLDVKAVMMDNEPSTTAPAFRAALRSPRLFLAFFYTTLVTTFASLLSLLAPWRELDAHIIWRALNDPYLVPAKARKCYIFSDTDVMFSWSDKIDDEGLHERQEFAVKRAAIDVKRRWTGDKERFWSGIQSVWEG